jgi:hypothetical protein
MTDAIVIQNEKAKYAKNLLPYKSTLNNTEDVVITNLNSNAIVELVSLNVPLYNKDRSIRATVIAENEGAFNLGDALQFVAHKDGLYILSTRIFISDEYSSNNIYGKINYFINSVSYELDFTNQDEGFVYNQWVTFAQTFEANEGDEILLAFKVGSDEIGTRVYFGGFDCRFDDRGLQGVPPFYAEPFNPNLGLIQKKTTAEIEAIAEPFESEQYYNTTLGTICYYNGTSWQKISHSNM